MRIKNILITALIVIIVPTTAYAVFIDTHTFQGNSFQASTLETYIETDRGKPYIEDKITDEEKLSFVVLIENRGQLTTLNNMFISKIDNEKFASIIKTVVLLDYSDLIYEGPLNEFKLNEYAKHTTGYGNKLQFILTISKEDLQNTAGQELNMVIQNHAWNSELKPGSGFFDNEYLELKIINPLHKEETKPLNEVTIDEKI